MSADPDTLISPHFPPEKLDSPTVEDMIDVFEDRTRGWLLEPVRRLVADRATEIPGFALSLSYFEGIWTYITGAESNSHSADYFTKAFVDVFRGTQPSEADLQAIGGTLYKYGRCGFFHDAMFRWRIYFGATRGGALEAHKENGEISAVLIQPSEFLVYLVAHFDRYVGAIRDSGQDVLRKRFEKIFREQSNLDGTAPVIHLP